MFYYDLIDEIEVDVIGGDIVVCVGFDLCVVIMLWDKFVVVICVNKVLGFIYMYLYSSVCC